MHIEQRLSGNCGLRWQAENVPIAKLLLYRHFFFIASQLGGRLCSDEAVLF
jgi:hypothetical protein